MKHRAKPSIYIKNRETQKSYDFGEEIHVNGETYYRLIRRSDNKPMNSMVNADFSKIDNNYWEICEK